MRERATKLKACFSALVAVTLTHMRQAHRPRTAKTDPSIADDRSRWRMHGGKTPPERQRRRSWGGRHASCGCGPREARSYSKHGCSQQRHVELHYQQFHVIGVLSHLHSPSNRP
jgi:hypothetical protein